MSSIQTPNSKTTVANPITPASAPMVCVEDPGMVDRMQQDFARACRKVVSKQYAETKSRWMGGVTARRLQAMELSLFNKIRKNITYKKPESDLVLMEPVDPELVDEVHELDAKLDALVERAKRYREEVPKAFKEEIARVISKNQENDEKSPPSETKSGKQRNEQQQCLAQLLEHLHEVFTNIDKQTSQVSKNLENLRTSAMPTILAAEKKFKKPTSTIEAAIKGSRCLA